MTTRCSILVLAASSLCACSGQIDGENDSVDPTNAPAPRGADRKPAAAPTALIPPDREGAPANTTPAPSGSAPQPVLGTSPACVLSPRRLVRLSASQYDNTVAALFGKTGRLSDGFSTATKSLGMGAGLGLGQAATADFFEAARTLARKASAEPALLDPCLTTAAPDAACVRKVVTTFGTRAFRRPLAEEEIVRFSAVYKKGVAAAPGAPGVAAGIEVVVRALLVSPHFLLRSELGGVGTGPTTLTPHERASALSYALADGPPDDLLMQSADSGALSRKDEVISQTRRLLGQSGAPGVMRFFDEYLGTQAAAGVSKEGSYAAQFSPEVATALVSETRAFLRDVIWQGDGRWSTALSADYSFIDDRLAKYYGVMNVVGPMLRKTTLPTNQRAGLLTQGSVMARLARKVETDPVARGKFVRELILCQKLPEPPANVPPIPAPLPNVTQRQRLERHRADPACSACHRLIDPLGLPFEAYDAAGRFRSTEGNKPVVTTGELTGTASSDGPVVDAVDLSRKLANAPETAQCLAKAAFVYLNARDDMPMDGSCGTAGLLEKARLTGGDVRALFLDLVTADTFFSRQ